MPAVELVEGDMLRPEILHAAFEGVERVLMISGARQQMLETQCAFIDSANDDARRHMLGVSPSFVDAVTETTRIFNRGALRGERGEISAEHHIDHAGAIR